MRNASPSNPRPPGRVPRRGLAALTLTATAMALMFSFRTPSEMFAGTDGTDSFSLVGDASAVAQSMSLPAATEPPTLPPATEPPATETPATEPPTPVPATEPPGPIVVTGQTVRTPYGPVQVEITFDASGITDIQALQLPSDRSYSARISRVVEPMLRQETLQTQSARINLISGATYTSTGYAMSLQSALDQAAASINQPG
jgi:uncharacterized protein with FMN-binding domain